MHLTEDFPLSSRLIRKTFRDEQKMNPNSARNIWKLLARTRPEPDPKNPTRFQLWFRWSFILKNRDKKTSNIVTVARYVVRKCESTHAIVNTRVQSKRVSFSTATNHTTMCGSLGSV